MARRLVEKINARESMVSSPRMPVKRPISATLVFCSANQTVHKRLGEGRRLVRNLITGLNHLPRRRHSRFGIVMDGAQRLAPNHALPHLLVQDEADSGIYGIFFLLPAAAQHHAGDSDLLALNRAHKPIPRAEHL